MSYFRRAQDIVVNTALEFGVVTTNTLQQFSCINGEIAGWKIQQLGNNPDNTPFYISQVYDCSGGSPVLKGNVSVLSGIDLTGGLFSSGCFPSGDALDINTVFYKVDYI